MTEPEIDEARFAAAQRVVKVAALRATPMDEDRCGTCLYYLEADEDLSFCWQEKVQILVGSGWWCQFWEMRDG